MERLKSEVQLLPVLTRLFFREFCRSVFKVAASLPRVFLKKRGIVLEVFRLLVKNMKFLFDGRSSFYFQGMFPGAFLLYARGS